jgi:hypothetical protein
VKSSDPPDITVTETGTTVTTTSLVIVTPALPLAAGFPALVASTDT